MTKTIDDYIKAAEEALDAAEKSANETNTSFSFMSAYGMGGTYVPLPQTYTKDQVESMMNDESKSEYDRSFLKRIYETFHWDEVDPPVVYIDFYNGDWSESSFDEGDYGWNSSSSNC